MERALIVRPGTSADDLLTLTTALSAAADPSDILDAMTAACPVLLDADLVNISLLDDDGTVLRLVSSLNTPLPVAEEFASYRVDAALPSRDALRSGEPVVLRSVAERDERYPNLAGVEVEQTSFCVLPLQIRGEGVGVLGLGWNDASQMDDDVLALARAVGNLCATALHRAMAAHEEVEARHRAEAALVRLAALQSVAAELAHATDVEAAARIVLASAIDTLGAEAATFHLLDDEARVARQIACVGIEDTRISAMSTWRVSDSMLAQEMLRTGLPVLIPDAQVRRDRFPDLDGSGVTQEAWADVPCAPAGGCSVWSPSAGRVSARSTSPTWPCCRRSPTTLAAAVDRARLDAANTSLLAEQTRVAETLQRSLLPAPLPAWEGVTIAAGYEPADVGTDVCGDFYDVFVATDGSLVGGHRRRHRRGIEAAGLTGMARHTLRALAGDLSGRRTAQAGSTPRLVDRSRSGDQRLLTACIVRLYQQGLARARRHRGLAGHCMPVLLRERVARHVGTPGMLLGATANPTIGVVTVVLDRRRPAAAHRRRHRGPPARHRVR